MCNSHPRNHFLQEIEMKRSIVALCVALLLISGANAYVYNFQPGPFPYPYPNTVDDYPNTAYCNYQTVTQPTAQYPSYRLEGVIAPYTQPNGSIIYFWSYQKMTSLGTNIKKIKPSPIPRAPLKETLVNDNYITPVIPARKYGWGKPF